VAFGVLLGSACAGLACSLGGSTWCASAGSPLDAHMCVSGQNGKDWTCGRAAPTSPPQSFIITGQPLPLEAGLVIRDWRNRKVSLRRLGRVVAVVVCVSYNVVKKLRFLFVLLLVIQVLDSSSIATTTRLPILKSSVGKMASSSLLNCSPLHCPFLRTCSAWMAVGMNGESPRLKVLDRVRPFSSSRSSPDIGLCRG